MHGDHLAERKDHGTVHAGPGHGASRSAPLCRRACRWLPPAVTKRLASCGSHAPAHSCGSSPADSAAAICAAPLLVCIPWIPALQGCKAGPSVPTSLHLVLTETGQDWLPDPTSYKALAGTSMSALPARRAAAHDLRDERRRVVGVTGPGEPLRRLTCAPPSPRRQVRRWPSSRLASASGAAPAVHASGLRAAARNSTRRPGAASLYTVVASAHPRCTQWWPARCLLGRALCARSPQRARGRSARRSPCSPLRTPALAAALVAKRVNVRLYREATAQNANGREEP